MSKPTQPTQPTQFTLRARLVTIHKVRSFQKARLTVSLKDAALDALPSADLALFFGLAQAELTRRGQTAAKEPRWLLSLASAINMTSIHPRQGVKQIDAAVCDPGSPASPATPETLNESDADPDETEGWGSAPPAMRTPSLAGAAALCILSAGSDKRATTTSSSGAPRHRVLCAHAGSERVA